MDNAEEEDKITYYTWEDKYVTIKKSEFSNPDVIFKVIKDQLFRNIRGVKGVPNPTTHGQWSTHPTGFAKKDPETGWAYEYTSSEDSEQDMGMGLFD